MGDDDDDDDDDDTRVCVNVYPSLSLSLSKFLSSRNSSHNSSMTLGTLGSQICWRSLNYLYRVMRNIYFRCLLLRLLLSLANYSLLSCCQ